MSLVLLYGLGGSPTAAPATPPTDDDADITVTAWADRDGATVRPPRTTLLHALDSILESALVGPDRLPMDRFEGTSERTGRTPNAGMVARLHASASRAADLLAPREIIVEYDVAPADFRIGAANTATGTDRDGASVAVPAWHLLHSADSALDSDLLPGSEDQDAFATSHALDPALSTGQAFRLVLETAGRAGSPSSVREIQADYTTSGDTPLRAASY